MDGIPESQIAQKFNDFFERNDSLFVESKESFEGLVNYCMILGLAECNRLLIEIYKVGFPTDADENRAKERPRFGGILARVRKVRRKETVKNSSRVNV